MFRVILTHRFTALLANFSTLDSAIEAGKATNEFFKVKDVESGQIVGFYNHNGWHGVCTQPKVCGEVCRDCQEIVNKASV